MVPGSMSAPANPMTTLYLRTGSPLRILTVAILYPAGTWLRETMPSPSMRAPMPTSTRATTILSFECRRMMGPVTRFSDVSIMVSPVWWGAARAFAQCRP
jgi:hypothetical protein